MSDLTSSKIKDTFGGVIQLPGGVATLTSTLVALQDLKGVATILDLSTTTFRVRGGLVVTGTGTIVGSTSIIGDLNCGNLTVAGDESVSGTVSASSFDGGLNATQLTQGTMPLARLGTFAAHFVLIGPTSGAAADPTARLLVATDIPDLSATYATLAYVANAVTGLLDFKGSADASGSPNYPAASKGDAYVVSVAGKVGGASGKPVDVGDVYVASADNAGGTEASVGTSWFVLEHNLQGALLSANNLSDVGNAATARTNLGLVIGTNVQAWDADLDALAALSGTNTIYYRSGAGTWTAVTIGANLAFSGGALSASFGAVAGDLTVAGDVSAGGWVMADAFAGNAASLFNLNASELTAGTVPLPRLSAVADPATGALRLPHLADSAAPNDSLYYSTDSAKAAYKDSGGTSHPLY